MFKKIMIIYAIILSVVALLFALQAGGMASTITPYPAALVNHPYAKGWTGAQLTTSFINNAPNDPGNCTNPNTGAITVSGNNAVLTSNGNDCEYLQSPHTYPTIDGYVYEEQITVSNWTAWSAFWGYGNNWPTDGEIDATEASPTGQNNISYHYAGNQEVSTYNNTITNPSNAQQLTQVAPGTHIVDFAFGGCGSGCGAISVWYDGHEVAFVSGTFVLNGGSGDDPFWIVDSNGKPETGSCGNPCGSITVNYLRIFT